MTKNSHFKIPKEVTKVTETLEKAGFESYMVGGCVRDLFLGRTPKDWDVTTNATPEEIMALFEETFYENDFGTVGIVAKAEDGEEIDPSVKVVEATPYRLETTYSDGRHPDKVHWSKELSEDLKRRDFTINAIALRIKEKGEEVVDLFEGRKDIQKGIIKTVGTPHERFREDGLRILRAVRLSAELGFEIEGETERAMLSEGELLKQISTERVRDEFTRIIMSGEPMRGIETMRKLGLLRYVLPELEEGIGCEQNKAHSFDVYEHLIRTLNHSAKKNFPLEVRLSALLHDIGKPESRRFSKEKNEYTFYGHDVISERMSKKILDRLKFPKKVIETVQKLTRWHMFFSDTEQITLSAVRRMVRNVGPENIWMLMDVRTCDRIGTGRPKESPYRLRKYHAMIDEAMRAPISVGQLKINGEILMKEVGVEAGPSMGFILHTLLEEVLEDPAKNEKEYLKKRAGELSLLSADELKKLGVEAKEKEKKIEEEEVKKLRGKHHVE